MAELIEVEHAALDLLAMFTRLLSKDIIGAGPSRQSDLAEAVTHIHALQNMVMSQAAARAYPGRYRLLGEPLTSQNTAATIQNRQEGP